MAMKHAISLLVICLTLLCGPAWAQDADSIKGTLTQNYINCLIWQDTAKADPSQGSIFGSFISDIENTMKQVDEAKLPDSTVINGTTDQPSSTIGEIRKKIPLWKEVASGATGAATKADEEKWAPFTSVLKDDRLTYFNRTHRSGYLVYTSGGKLLEQPGDFQKAKVWYTYTFDRDTIPPTWTVTARQFTGNAFDGEPSTTNGAGDRPPTSAYK